MFLGKSNNANITLQDAYRHYITLLGITKSKEKIECTLTRW